MVAALGGATHQDPAPTHDAHQNEMSESLQNVHATQWKCDSQIESYDFVFNVKIRFYYTSRSALCRTKWYKDELLFWNLIIQQL